MRVSDAFPSKYLSAKDLGGRVFQLPISGVQMEEIQDNDGKKHKPVIFFQGAQKGMILNKTNAESISMVLGDETNDWIGHKLELFVMKVQGPNGIVDGLRCRVILPQNAGGPAPVQRQPAPEIHAPLGHAPLVRATGPLPAGNSDLDDTVPF